MGTPFERRPKPKREIIRQCALPFGREKKGAGNKKKNPEPEKKQADYESEIYRKAVITREKRGETKQLHATHDGKTIGIVRYSMREIKGGFSFHIEELSVPEELRKEKIHILLLREILMEARTMPALKYISIDASAQDPEEIRRIKEMGFSEYSRTPLENDRRESIIHYRIYLK